MTDPADYLRQVGEAGEAPLDIARVALMLSALDHSGRDLESYEEHLDEIAEAARKEARLSAYIEDGARSLSALMVGRFGYDGDRMSYDDPQNADLMAVIDRRRGLPVALGILYIHAARAAGFDAHGLNAPNHFLLRIALRGHEALLDPFNGGAALDRERLGGPPAMGTAISEDVDVSDPVSDIDVLLRLQNNLKIRALNGGERVRALEVAKRMVLIAPKKPQLWMDMARLNEASGALGAAQRAYEACLTLAKAGQGLHNEAALSLQALKRRLN
jgi:regulator of sirC expression with transglutaminase-like and TPR domain